MSIGQKQSRTIELIKTFESGSASIECVARGNCDGGPGRFRSSAHIERMQPVNNAAILIRLRRPDT